MSYKSYYSWTVTGVNFQSYCLLLVEKVFTLNKSISLSKISAIKIEDPKLPSTYERKLKSQS